MKKEVAYQCAMDGDRRIALPLDIRRSLAKGRKQYVVVMRGRDGRLCLLRPSDWDALLARVRSGLADDAEYLAAVRYLAAAGLQAFPDNRGRITIPSWYFPEAVAAGTIDVVIRRGFSDEQ